MAYSAFKKFTMAMCFSSPQATMICCHSAIDFSYFFSMEGKYEAGPCDGQVLVMANPPLGSSFDAWYRSPSMQRLITRAQKDTLPSAQLRRT